jgi:hypothetical protein
MWFSGDKDVQSHTFASDTLEAASAPETHRGSYPKD